MKEEAYTVIQGTKEGLPWVGMVSTNFEEFENKETLPWSVVVSIKLTESNEALLPTGPEAETLNDFEDLISNELSKSKNASFFMGRINWNRFRNLYFYVQDPEPVHKWLQDLIDRKDHSNEFSYSIEMDPNWIKAASIFQLGS